MGYTDNKAMQQRRTCQLYVYLLTSQGLEVPEYIEECADSYDYPVECMKELSEAVSSLDSETFDKLLNTESQDALDLLNWWRMYQDAQRLHRELSSDAE